ncbi:hypothetical protein ACTFIT_003044 [Dictyostelium discoideum]
MYYQVQLIIYQLISLDNFIGDNNEIQQDFSIFNCQTALSFCKNKLNVVKGAALIDKLENLKTNLIYIKYILSTQWIICQPRHQQLLIGYHLFLLLYPTQQSTTFLTFRPHQPPQL